MDKLSEIVSFQNYELLKNIAESKFNDKVEIEKFINKYHKYNYHVLKVSKDDQLLEYSYNRIINIQTAFDL